MMSHEYAFAIDYKPVVHQNVRVLQDGTNYGCSGVMDLEPKTK